MLYHSTSDNSQRQPKPFLAQMKALLHIGDQKNGSKAYQDFLLKFRPQLLEMGLLAPTSTKIKNHGYDSILQAVGGEKEFVELASRSFEFEHDLLWKVRSKAKESLQDELTYYHSRVHTLLLSFEGLVHLPASGLTEVKQLFQDLVQDISIICSFRRQDRKLCSAFTTKLLHNLKWAGPHPFFNSKGSQPRKGELLENNNYAKHILNWQSEFGYPNVSVLKYEDHSSDIVNGILSSTISPLPSLLKIWDDNKKECNKARINNSLSHTAQTYIHSFNTYLNTGQLINFKSCSPIDLISLRQQVSKQFTGTSYRPKRSTAEKFYLVNFSESNHALSRILGHKNNDFFDLDFTEYPLESPERLELLPKKLVKEIFCDIASTMNII